MLADVQTVGAAEFEKLREAMLQRYLRITSRSADGFIIDLGNALEKAGLDKVKVRWRGGEDGLFTATGEFEGNVENALAVVLGELDDVAYQRGPSCRDGRGRA